MEKAINSNYNNFEEPQNNLKAVVVGGSGAIGRELIKELILSPKWSEVHVIVRRTLPEWKKLENIPHFSLLSSTGADKKSIFLYTKTKGRAEEGLKSKELPVLSIFRPGALLNRDNDKRWGETLLKYIPFFPKIEATDMAKAMRVEAELILERKNIHKSKDINIYNNDQIKSLLKI